MSASFPDAIKTFRAVENRDGIVYDANDTKRLYAEDLQQIDEEIVAIETELGTDPKGADASVKARLDRMDGEIDACEPALGYTPEDVANKVTALADPTDDQYPSALLLETLLGGKQDSLTAEVLGDTIAGMTEVTNWTTDQYFLFSDGNDNNDAKKMSYDTIVAGILQIIADNFAKACYVLAGNNTINTPADNTIYYFGAPAYTGSTNQGYSKWVVPVTGKIKRCDLVNYYSGTQPSNETSSLYIRKNETTNYLVLDATFHNETNKQVFSNSALDIAVSAGDTIEMRWNTPTWATNPGTSLIFRTQIYIEPEL